MHLHILSKFARVIMNAQFDWEINWIKFSNPTFYSMSILHGGTTLKLENWTEIFRFGVCVVALRMFVCVFVHGR